MNMKTLTETSTFRVLHPCDECERFQSASRQV